jgi:hypothetical protein
MDTDSSADNTRPSGETRIAGTGPTLANETTQAAIRHHYPASAFRGPLFEIPDRTALAMATAMLIGPLVALPLGV